MTDHLLYIQGKKVGTTNVSIYNDSHQLIKIVDVEVGLDTGNLQAKIRAVTGNNGMLASPQQVMLEKCVSSKSPATPGGRTRFNWSWRRWIGYPVQVPAWAEDLRDCLAQSSVYQPQLS